MQTDALKFICWVLALLPLASVFVIIVSYSVWVMIGKDAQVGLWLSLVVELCQLTLIASLVTCPTLFFIYKQADVILSRTSLLSAVIAALAMFVLYQI